MSVSLTVGVLAATIAFVGVKLLLLAYFDDRKSFKQWWDSRSHQGCLHSS